MSRRSIQLSAESKLRARDTHVSSWRARAGETEKQTHNDKGEVSSGVTEAWEWRGRNAASMKTGPFAEHSNQLWNISAVPSWSKVNQGLIRMYKAEVRRAGPGTADPTPSAAWLRILGQPL